jgi:hypothetical protein
MKFQILFLIGVLTPCLAIVPASAHAQSQSQAAAPQPADASAPQPPPQAQAAPLANAKPAKVWTNEEIESLPKDRGISVVGKQTTQKPSATTSRSNSGAKDPTWYRRQIQPLREEIEKLDGQIEKTKAFLNGDKVNDPASVRAYISMPGNPQDQLKRLETRRQADQAKLDDLLDRARHNGVEPGALR